MGRQGTQLNKRRLTRRTHNQEEAPKVPIVYHRKDTNRKITNGCQKPRQTLETKSPSNEAKLPDEGLD
jgi:hypothetical protein